MLRIRNTLPKLRVNFDNKKNVLIPKGFFQNQKGMLVNIVLSLFPKFQPISNSPKGVTNSPKIASSS